MNTKIYEAFFDKQINPETGAPDGIAPWNIEELALGGRLVDQTHKDDTRRRAVGYLLHTETPRLAYHRKAIYDIMGRGSTYTVRNLFSSAHALRLLNEGFNRSFIRVMCTSYVGGVHIGSDVLRKQEYVHLTHDEGKTKALLYKDALFIQQLLAEHGIKL